MPRDVLAGENKGAARVCRDRKSETAPCDRAAEGGRCHRPIGEVGTAFDIVRSSPPTHLHRGAERTSDEDSGAGSGTTRAAGRIGAAAVAVSRPVGGPFCAKHERGARRPCSGESPLDRDGARHATLPLVRTFSRNALDLRRNEARTMPPAIAIVCAPLPSAMPGHRCRGRANRRAAAARDRPARAAARFRRGRESAAPVS